MKKGISPLIATVLIVGFTILLAVLILNFILNLTEKQTDQTQCESEANSVCLAFTGTEKFQIDFLDLQPLGTPDGVMDTLRITNLASKKAEFKVSVLDNTDAILETISAGEINLLEKTDLDSTDFNLGFPANPNKVRVYPSGKSQVGDYQCEIICTDNSITKPAS